MLLVVVMIKLFVCYIKINVVTLMIVVQVISKDKS